MGSSSMMKSFTVKRKSPVLIRPAKPTPHETKPLSDIDDQVGLRFQNYKIHFYRRKPSNDENEEEDPAKVIQAALAKTLGFYYPYAGRLREGPGRKLMVECTGEGVLFIEAEADVTLDEFGEEIRPPFPCMDELLFNVPGSDGILHTPLLLIQVTRLQCGGFIFAYRLNHTMSDAVGFVQFMMAVAEIARGSIAPSTLPVWNRELLNARDPPKVTYIHREYDIVQNPKEMVIQAFSNNDFVCKSFFFGSTEISDLRAYLPSHLKNKCTKFEVLTAYLWRCRTIALQLDPDQKVRMLFYVNARSKFDPQLFKGYYGNVLATPVAQTTALKLTKNPLGYATELVMKAKLEVTVEYMKSNADLIVIRERRPDIMLSSLCTFLVSDITRVGFDEVDFGWGKSVYIGLAIGDIKEIHVATSCYVPVKNKDGEKGILVPICLPKFAMERFVQLMEMVGKKIKPDNDNDEDEQDFLRNIRSSL